MSHEFLLSVTHIQGNEYLIRTEKVEPYVPLAEERLQWDLEEWLEQSKILMNDPVLLLLQGNRDNQNSPLFIPKKSITKSNSPQSLISLGKTLYNALFSGSIRDSWITAQTLAQSQRCVLRLRLALKHKPLLSLPWEVVHPSDTEGFHPIVTGTEVAFSRYQPYKIIKNVHLLSSPAFYEPLKILIVISAPNDQETLSLQKEVKHLQEELTQESFPEARDIVLTVLKNPGREELTQALEQGKYQVFHYAGHSNIGNSGGSIYLVNRNTGLTENFSGDDLAGLLANNGIQLAVFNSCHSADNNIDDTTEDGVDVNLAQALVKQGIPAVLAMAAQIPDQVALTFTRLVYRNINQGYAIDLSLSRARQGLISAYGSNQLYWALPVLYLHSQFDGILIEVDEPRDQDQAWYHMLEDNEISSHEEILENEQTVISLEENSPDNSEEMLVKSILEEVKKQSIDKDEDTIKPNSQKEKEKTNINNNNLENITPLKPIKFRNFKFLRNIRLIMFGSVVIITVAGGLWFYIQGQNQPRLPYNNSNNLNTPLSLDDIDTANITAIAIEQLSQGNLEQGSLAVEKLLDEGILNYAESALIQVDPSNLDDPQINFLFGRLAWQYYWLENPNYSLDDVRRYWELSIKENPNAIEYHNALGFAYYAEGDMERANEAWFNALDIINSSPTNTLNMNALNTHAGLALALKKTSQNYSGKQKQDLVNQSLAFREKVIKNNALQFQGEALAKPENWIWSQPAINDWLSFLETQS